MVDVDVFPCDPHTGKRPYAVVQLRKENNQGTLLNLVGTFFGILLSYGFVGPLASAVANTLNPELEYLKPF